jgi:hypothetical protein
MQNGERVEVSATDRDGVYVYALNHHETHLQQPEAPDDAAAMISIGRHRVECTHSMGRDRERKWIELLDGAYLNADQAVEIALLLLESAAAWRAEQDPEGGPPGPVADDDPRRWDLHVHACSLHDSTFWVRKRDDGQFDATEVETGCAGAPAPTIHEAMANYLAGRYAHGTSRGPSAPAAPESDCPLPPKSEDSNS